jgi:hypothetical protein
MEMLTNSIILPGPIENLQGIRARQTPEEEKYLHTLTVASVTDYHNALGALTLW